MAKITESDLSSLLLKNTAIRPVEPAIYSILPNNETGNEYDTQFGYIYDWVACNPIYNRLIWGYPVKILSQMANEALHSATQGNVLDIGCGSLAFTAETYSNYFDRPVILVDQSLQMLRIAKSRVIQHNGKVPDNLVFLHADALHLPFKEKIFTTLVSENLLHCLNDTSILLKKLKVIVSEEGDMYFSTLIKSNRFADKYLMALADSGKLVPRTVGDHASILDKLGMSAKYETIGNMLLIRCENSKQQAIG